MLLSKRFAFPMAIAFALATFGTTQALEPGVSPLQELYMIKELTNGSEIVGVMLNIGEGDHADLLTKIQRASAQTGMKVVVAEVTQLSEVAQKFRELKESYHIQVLWVPQDESVIGSPISRDFLIKNSTLSSIPLFAPNQDWVTSGACVALSLEGGSVKLYVNRKTLAALGLKVPDKYIPSTQFLASN